MIKHAILRNAVVVNDYVIPGLSPSETPEWLPEALYRRLEEVHALTAKVTGYDLSDLALTCDARHPGLSLITLQEIHGPLASWLNRETFPNRDELSVICFEDLRMAHEGDVQARLAKVLG